MKKTKTKTLVLINYKSGHSVAFYSKVLRHTNIDFSYEIDEDITNEDIERAQKVIEGKNTYLIVRPFRMAHELTDIESSFIIAQFEVPLLKEERI